jgi:hypothetical protein
MTTQNYSLTRATLIALFFTAPFASSMTGQNVTQQWVQTYSYCNTCSNPTNEAQSVGIDIKENVYVGGYSSQADNDMNWAVVKYSSTGTQLWAARYGGAAGGFDALYDMKVDFKTGNVYATGKSIESGTQPVYTTIKYNTNGVRQWVAHYGDSNGAATADAIAIDPSGNSYVTGWSYEGGNTLIATVKYNSSGAQQWVARYSLYSLGGGDHLIESAGGTDLVVDGNGNVYVAGYTGSQIVTIKYNSQGVEQWHSVYGGSTGFPEGIALDPAGSVYVTGASTVNSNAHGYLTIKYDTAGNQMWVSTYEGPGNGPDASRAIVYDPITNSVVVTGGSFDSANTATYLTIKYNVTSGGTIWAERYMGPVDYDGANAITADGSGNIYVTGGSAGIGTGYDYATVKYNQNGVQQWYVRYDSGFGNDFANGIKVSTSGNIYVTGTVAASSGDSYGTVKYSQN